MIEEVVGRWNNKRKRKVGKVYLLKKINVKNKYRKIEKKKKKQQQQLWSLSSYNNNNNVETFQALGRFFFFKAEKAHTKP